MSIWWILLIFIIIAISLALILYFIYPRLSPRNNTNNQQQIIAGIGQLCNNTTVCGSSLVCQPTNGNDTGICKQPLGGPCLILSDCNTSGTNGANICQITGSNTIGVCARTNIGILNGACPCNTGLTCVQFPTGNVCKLSPGDSCSLNSHCSVGICDNGICSIGKTIGQSCSANQCAGGLECSLGWCQVQGQTTGNQGAFCNVQDNPGCNNGLSCIQNTCQPSTSILGAACNTSLQCDPPLTCVVGNGESSGICYYPVPVNSCVSGACLSGFICGLSNQCLAQTGQSCQLNSNCLNNNCGLLPGAYTWDIGNEWNKSLTVFPENLAIEALQTNFISDIQIDTWIINDNGLYFSVYNRNNNTFSSWSFILPTQNVVEGVMQTIITSSLSIDNNGTVWLAAHNQGLNTWDGLYTLVLLQDGSGVLEPYNTTVGQLPGEQFYNGQGIRIASISVSINNDILLTGTVLTNNNSNLYIKSNNNLVYSSGPAGHQGSFIRPTTNTTTQVIDNYGYITSNRQAIVFSGQLANLSYPQPLPNPGAPAQTFNVLSFNFFQSIIDPLLGPWWFLVEITSGGSGYVLYSVENNVQYTRPGYFSAGTVFGSLPSINASAPSANRNILLISNLQCRADQN